jgi:hypothetical protein
LDVDDVERDDQVIGTVYPVIELVSCCCREHATSSLFKGANDTRLASDLPDPVFVADTVVHDH